MVAPLIVKIIIFSVAKKATVFLIAKLYGFPRLYRRMAELNRYINKNNPKRQESVENGLQRLFRLPTRIYQSLQRWRGVPEPPQGPPSATGHTSSGASSSPAQHPSQQTQVREIHTSVRNKRVSILNVVEPSSQQGGLKYISQSIQSHLLGLKGNRKYSSIRPEVFCKILPFGVSNLAKQKQDVESLQTWHVSTNGSSGSQAVHLKEFSLTKVRPGSGAADLLEPRTVPEASGLQVLL